MYSRDTEIRHLTSADIYKLGQILDQTNSWKKLMRIIPKNLLHSAEASDQHKSKYTNDHIRLIENASIKQNRMFTEILFDEWGTSGKNRPTVGNLLELLINAELFRAADFVADFFLKEAAPNRPLQGPAAKIDISIPLAADEIQAIEDILNAGNCPGTMTLNDMAEVPSDIINKDYYEKFANNDKNLQIEHSDLMKFSLSNVGAATVCSSMDSDNIPNEIIEAHNPMVANVAAAATANESLSSTKKDSNFNANITSIEIDMDNSECGDADGDDNIPILSALNVIDIEMSEEQIPDFSALNVIEGDTGSGSRSGSFGNSSSLSTHTDDADGDNITPNLSILDQKSNDDSSLTNVTDTDTSENISFENETTNESGIEAAESIIPCIINELQN